MELERFIQRWTFPAYPPEGVLPSDLDAAEHQLGVHFPLEYRDAILQAGLPRPTIALLNSIVDQDLDLRDVSEFFSPSEILATTFGAREAGMPPQLIAFASDCAGNMFCFDADKLRSADVDQNAIWFFDHDFCVVEPEAPGFAVWINRFCQVEPSPPIDESDR